MEGIEELISVDAAGSWDCFNSAIVVGLSEGKSLKEAAEFVVKAAAHSDERKCAGDSMPLRNELI